MRRAFLPLAVAVAAGIPAATASATVPLGTAELLPSTVVRADGAKLRTCHARLAAGRPGVVTRRLTVDATGMVRATLLARSGDWDLGVFEATSGKTIAGASGFRSDELAEGFARAGTPIVVQACRRSGNSRTARVRVANIPLAAHDGGTAKLVEVALPFPASRDLLNSLDLDLAEHAHNGMQDVVVYDAADEAKLVKAGLAYNVVVPNLYAADRAALFGRSANDGPPEPMPSGRTEYRRLPDFSADLKKLAEANPDWIKPIVMPNKSLEGRPVEGVEITRDVKNESGKPVFLNVGIHHAREWPSAEMVIEWATELSNGITAKDERITGLLEKARVIAVPIVNPDGYNLSREALVDSRQPVVDPDFAYKRKNCRVVDGEIPAEGVCGEQSNRAAGTDPNRNYGQFWGGPGAGTNPPGETYRGAGPFSEPETQNIRAIVSSRQVQTLITNHTYSDLILRPPGLASQGDPPDEALLKALGDAMAAENGYTSQKGWELYDTTGTTEDWSYSATGGVGYTFEIGYARPESTLVGVGFHPPYPSGVIAEYYGKNPTGGGNREAYFIALTHTADAKNHAVLEGDAPAGAQIRVTKSFMTFPSNEEAAPFKDVLDSRMTVPSTGKFEYHVNQSTRPIAIKSGLPAESWTVECITPDGKTASRQDVMINRGERKSLGTLCGALGDAPAALTLTVTPGNGKRALRKGLAVAATCSAACSLTAKLTAKVGRRTIVLGSAKRTAATGKATLKLKLSRKAAAKVKRLRKVKALLRVSATTSDGKSAAKTRRVTLTR